MRSFAIAVQPYDYVPVENVPNQTYYYTRRITPKCVTSLRCPARRYNGKVTQLPIT